MRTKWASAAFAAASAAIIWGKLALPSVQKAEQLHFREIAHSAGLNIAMHNGDPARRWITEANGNGAAWLDYDNDGLMDLLIVNGSDMANLRGTLAGKTTAARKGSVYLFHNLGNGHFADVTAQSGIENPYWGTGANAADFDNDGFTDIFITTIGRDMLFHNNGNGTFTEIGKRSGIRQDVAWHTGSAFGDFDGDGKLDLFVTGYIDVHAVNFDEPAPVCDYQGQKVFCGPIGLKGGRSLLYRNNGDGTFKDVTESSGIAKAAPAHGFTALTGDFNSDGKLDIVVANDSDPNYLFLNNGDGTFTESALDRGVAFNADGRTQSNMGITAGELGRSGHLDLLTTTFSKDYFPLFRRSDTGAFEEIAGVTGIATATKNYLGWACGLADFSNSGSDDFWTANGHVYPTDKDYNEPIAILGAEGTKAALAYSYPDKPDNSYRGGGAADFENNGGIGLLVLPIEGAPVLLRNEGAAGQHWTGIQLRGTRSNRDGIGAVVRVEACGQTQSQEARNGGSYLSRNDPRLHFGLGPCNTVNSVSVRWPSGRTSIVKDVSPDRYTTIQEPE